MDIKVTAIDFILFLMHQKQARDIFWLMKVLSWNNQIFFILMEHAPPPYINYYITSTNNTSRYARLVLTHKKK